MTEDERDISPEGRLARAMDAVCGDADGTQDTMHAEATRRSVLAAVYSADSPTVGAVILFTPPDVVLIVQRPAHAV
jgi:hypothetical protein